MIGRALALAMLMAAGAQAGEIYRWVDEQGVVHFSDDPTKIPPKAKPSKAHPARLIVMGGHETKASPGEEAFAKRCAGCHVLFPEEDQERTKEPLIDVLRTSDGTLRGEDEVYAELRKAARGEGNSDMDPIEVSDEELKAIARWLLQRAM